MNVSLETYLNLFSKDATISLFDQSELEFIIDRLAHKNPDSQFLDSNSNPKNKFFEIPDLDVLIRKKIKDAGLESRKIWGDDNSFAVCLTHDVDRIESYSPKSFIRTLKKKRRFTKSSKTKFFLKLTELKTLIKSKVLAKKSDPLWCYERWSEIEKKFNVKSTYFFFVRPQGVNVYEFDCDYLLSDEMKFNGNYIQVTDYIQQLKKDGHEIGLHGSFISAEKIDHFKDQKQKLEKVINEQIISTRQHYLHYIKDHTTDLHISSDIKIDSSFGSNYNVGFFNGTSFPIPYFNSNGFIWELPLILMDSSLFQQEIDLESGKLICDKLLNQVEKAGGILTINFHPDYLIIEKYWKLYEYILSEATKRKAYFSTCSGILKKIEKCAE
jgi:hypothetical protein